jgi:hypothetical protein
MILLRDHLKWWRWSLMTTDDKMTGWLVAGCRAAGWPVPFPVGLPVVVPSCVAQWALRTFALRGGRLGMPVIVVGDALLRLSFASDGAWWVVRLPYPAGLVYDLSHVHRLLPVVVRGRVGVECTLCGWEA